MPIFILKFISDNLRLVRRNHFISPNFARSDKYSGCNACLILYTTGLRKKVGFSLLGKNYTSFKRIKTGWNDFIIRAPDNFHAICGLESI